MGGKNSAPDYQGAAVAQGDANREVVRDQTFANRPEQYTPFGSESWNPYEAIDPSTGESTTRWQQTTSLTPELQDVLNKQIAIQSGRADIAGRLTGRLGTEFGAPVDWRGLNPMGTVPTAQFTIPEEYQRDLDFSGAPEVGDPTRLRDRAEDAVYGRGMDRLTSEFDSRQRQMEIKLRNQGLAPEDEAWRSQMEGLGLQRNDAVQGLREEALRQGRAEQSQLFGQDVTRRGMATGEAAQQGQFARSSAQDMNQQAFNANQANFGQAMQASQYANALRQNQITEAMAKRGFSLNEINALMSGQQVGLPQMPDFTGASAAQPAPVYTATADQASYNNATNPMQGLLTAGTGLGSAAITRGLFG